MSTEAGYFDEAWHFLTIHYLYFLSIIRLVCYSANTLFWQVGWRWVPYIIHYSFTGLAFRKNRDKRVSKSSVDMRETLSFYFHEQI